MISPRRTLVESLVNQIISYGSLKFFSVRNRSWPAKHSSRRADRRAGDSRRSLQGKGDFGSGIVGQAFGCCARHANRLRNSEAGLGSGTGNDQQFGLNAFRKWYRS